MKKLFLLITLASLCLGAEASYLYWQVAKNDYKDLKTADDVNAYGLYALSGDTKTLLADGSKMGTPIDVTDYSKDFSFIIELYKYDETSKTYAQLGQGETKSYTDLSNAGYIQNDMVSVAQAQVWHGGTYSVPEPTSGFLMMVGMALLGLKRRKV